MSRRAGDVEVGHYAVRGGLVLYVNHGGVCVFRERIALADGVPEAPARERLALLRRLWPAPNAKTGESGVLPCSG